MFSGSRVGDIGFCMQWWGNESAPREDQEDQEGQTQVLFLLLESTDDMVEMRGCKRKEKYPLVSKAKDLTTKRGAELDNRTGYQRRCTERKVSLGTHILSCMDIHMHAELGLLILHLPT